MNIIQDRQTSTIVNINIPINKVGRSKISNRTTTTKLLIETDDWQETDLNIIMTQNNGQEITEIIKQVETLSIVPVTNNGPV